MDSQWLLVIVALLGLLAGGFNTILIDRVPKDEQVTLTSRCPSCRGRIATADTIPLWSWVRLGKRCRNCGETIAARYPVVEVGTTVVCVLTAAVIGPTWELPAFLYLASMGVALAVIDLDAKRLPNALTLPSYPIMFGLLLIAALGSGQWDDFSRAVIGGVAMFSFYLVLALVNPSGMGMGDVKFSGVVGMALAWLGWDAWVVGALAAFLLGAVAGLFLLLAGRGRGTSIPFGPYIVAGALVGVAFGSEATQWYGRLLHS